LHTDGTRPKSDTIAVIAGASQQEAMMSMSTILRSC
jgi:hypothetical protein